MLGSLGLLGLPALGKDSIESVKNAAWNLLDYSLSFVLQKECQLTAPAICQAQSINTLAGVICQARGRI